MLELTFPVSPVAASRPRVGRHGSYYTGAYKRFRAEASSVIMDVLGFDFEPIEGKLNVDIECYCKRPKTTKLECPKSDIDNIAKAVLDILNDKLWVDDNQIVRLYITKQWAPAGEPGYFNIALEKTIV
jgi:Holliday junction resolvase RusA-like endonuclease